MTVQEFEYYKKRYFIIFNQLKRLQKIQSLGEFKFKYRGRLSKMIYNKYREHTLESLRKDEDSQYIHSIGYVPNTQLALFSAKEQ